MHRPSGRWPGSARLWSVWSSRVINLQELIIQTRPVSVHPGNWGRGSWQGPWFWVCTAAPERLREPNCWRQVHKTGGKKRTSLSCFLQFPYKVSQSQLTIQLILIASRVPAPSPCFFCFFYVCVSHVNRIRSVEYFNYGNNKKTTLLLFLFSLFGGSASSRPPAGGNHFPPPWTQLLPHRNTVCVSQSGGGKSSRDGESPHLH